MNDTLATIPDEFEAVADRPADRLWATRALLVLTGADLASPHVRDVMVRALGTVRASGASADDVFGDPTAWAHEQLAEVSQSGATFTDNDSTANDLGVVGFGLASLMALLFGLLSVLRGHWSLDWSLVMAAFPLMLSVVTIGSLTLRERLVHHHSNLVALVITLLAIVPVVVLLGWLAVNHPVPLGRHSVVWWLAIAAAMAAGAWLIGRLVPDPAPRAVSTFHLDDEAWLREARVKFRERGDLSEAQVEQRLDEARAHAAEAGTSLAEEFGNPIGYVHQMPENQVNRHRFTAILWTLLAIMWGAFTIEAWSRPAWWEVAATLLTLGAAIGAWRSTARARAQRNGQISSRVGA